MNDSSHRFRLISASALFVLCCALYWPSVGYDFVDVDDAEFVSANPYVRAGWNLETIRWAFTQSHASNWMPLSFLSLALDSTLFGLEPAGYHRSNVLLHALAAVLLFCACLSLSGRRWRSLLLAAIWAAHPLRVESVAWIAERKDVLSAVFGFAAIWAYAAAVRGGQRGRWILCFCLLSLGLLSKAMLVSWPLLFLLLDIWPLARSLSWRRRILSKWPFFLLVAAASSVTFLAQRGGGAVSSLQRLSLEQRLENAIVSYVRYLERTFWPHDLAYLYPHPAFASPPHFAWPLSIVLGSTILVGALTALSIWLARRARPQLLVGWAWFLICLLPVLGLVQVGVQSIADRYTYLPQVGLLLALIFVWPQPSRLPLQRALIAGLFVVAGLAAWRSSAQLPVWRNSEALFSRAIATTQNNFFAQNGLGAYLARSGNLAAALPHLEEAVRIGPSYASAHINLGIVLGLNGDYNGSLRHYQTALRLEPSSPLVHIALGNLYAAKGELLRAEEHLLRARDFDPMRWQVHFNLGLVQLQIGKSELGRASVRRALALDPQNPTIRARLQELERSGN